MAWRNPKWRATTLLMYQMTAVTDPNRPESKKPVLSDQHTSRTWKIDRKPHIYRTSHLNEREVATVRFHAWTLHREPNH